LAAEIEPVALVQLLIKQDGDNPLFIYLPLWLEAEMS
jgi:hypothetical protein